MQIPVSLSLLYRSLKLVKTYDREQIEQLRGTRRLVRRYRGTTEINSAGFWPSPARSDRHRSKN